MVPVLRGRKDGPRGVTRTLPPLEPPSDPERIDIWHDEVEDHEIRGGMGAAVIERGGVQCLHARQIDQAARTRGSPVDPGRAQERPLPGFFRPRESRPRWDAVLTLFRHGNMLPGT